jgi:hypothetical protein
MVDALAKVRWFRLQGAGPPRKSRRTGMPLQIVLNAHKKKLWQLGLRGDLTKHDDDWGR